MSSEFESNTNRISCFVTQNLCAELFGKILYLVVTYNYAVQILSNRSQEC